MSFEFENIKLRKENARLQAELDQVNACLRERLAFLEDLRERVQDVTRRLSGKHTDTCLANMACSGTPCCCGVRKLDDTGTTEENKQA